MNPSHQVVPLRTEDANGDDRLSRLGRKRSLERAVTSVVPEETLFLTGAKGGGPENDNLANREITSLRHPFAFNSRVSGDTHPEAAHPCSYQLFVAKILFGFTLSRFLCGQSEYDSSNIVFPFSRGKTAAR